MPRALATVQTPDSFADEEYYGVNAFILVNDKGERHAVRYLLAPDPLIGLRDGAYAVSFSRRNP